MNPKGPYVIGLNGPPRSGKDTIATHIVDTLDPLSDIAIHRHALVAPMRDSAFALLGLNGGDRFYNEQKDKPLELLNGRTLRDFMIDMSEAFVKSIYGKDFWSRRLYATNQHWWYSIPSILIITDIGFSAEVEFLCEHSRSYLGVVIDRDGTDYTGDSRSNVWSQTHGGIDLAISNNDTPQRAAEQIIAVAARLGWPVL